MVKSAPGRSFLGHVKFGSFLFVSSCIKVLVKLKEEFSNRLARYAVIWFCRPYCLRAIGQNELLFHKYRQLDRAELDQGWGWITFLAMGERKVITCRQLEILFGFTYGEGTHWDIKEDELQRVWATIAEPGFSSSRSKAAQIRSHVHLFFFLLVFALLNLSLNFSHTRDCVI
ncbi:unnamed protein product [Microthlaspi erraticum]|uniref:Arabidopsis retrotransposon Orf1 C-terminal domain-containing protein n=1 Tax=Microthlaspi erraticum TaxID=1685480 RepID=A0A6D2JEM1_9BRAS|nr:unnamed protein product [Microthlaspi erraticum]